MWLRINYFPMLLSFATGTPMHDYYVVPLHTAGFFMTMATCYVAFQFKSRLGWERHRANVMAIMLSLLVHVLFYEPQMCQVLNIFSKEYYVRFRMDKYSAWVGILSGFFWTNFSDYMQWAYGGGNGDRWLPLILQRVLGLTLLGAWYHFFGYIPNAQKTHYNAIHPYIFWLPVAGWLMIRNSSKFLTEIHSAVLEFFGQITLETYVLQFHLLMCQKVQHIPIVLPGSGPSGALWLKTANMLICGVIFVSVALWARKLTITTQTSLTELVTVLRSGNQETSNSNDLRETEMLVKESADESNASHTSRSSMKSHSHRSISTKDSEITTKTSNLTNSLISGEQQA